MMKMGAKEDKVDVAGSMVWALLKPFLVIFGGLVMLVMLVLVAVQGQMLADYCMSERVYPARADVVDPALEGKLVRVSGPLCTTDTVNLPGHGSFPQVLEVDNLGSYVAAQNLTLGVWQVEHLYGWRRQPFGYLHLNQPGVEQVETPEGSVLVLRSGAEVTVVARQRGNVLDFTEDGTRACLGEASPRYADRVDNRETDVSLESFEGVAAFALLVYAGFWLLMGLVFRRWWRGPAIGGGLLLLIILLCFLSSICRG